MCSWRYVTWTDVCPCYIPSCVNSAKLSPLKTLALSNLPIKVVKSMWRVDSILILYNYTLENCQGPLTLKVCNMDRRLSALHTFMCKIIKIFPLKTSALSNLPVKVVKSMLRIDSILILYKILHTRKLSGASYIEGM